MQGLRAIFQMLLSNVVLHIPSFPTIEARRAPLTTAVMLTRLPGSTGQCPVTKSRHILPFLGNNLSVTIPQHEEHRPSFTAEKNSSTPPPYQWLLQFSCRRHCIHKSILWNAPIRERCNKIHLYYWNINYVCKETGFFSMSSPATSPSSAELSIEQDREVVHRPPASS